MKLKYFTVLALAAMCTINIDAQNQLTREQILNMSIEELSDLPLEDLMQAVETLGVSSVDELFAIIMNKNVSSASKKEENSFTSPLSSTVITRDEMRTYGISAIEEAFRLIPGMIVSEKANGVYDIQMRGLNNIPDNNMLLYTENANTLLMIDGRPVHNTAMGAVNFDMLPIGIEDVERIEVVRGACGALYGSNAVTGVINIITEHPSEGSKLVSGNIQMGSQNTYVGEFAIRKAFNNKIAAGLTFNLQSRERNTDKLYLIPASGTFMVTNAAGMPNAGDQLYTPYYYICPDQQTPTMYYNAEKLAASMQSYQTVFGSMKSVEEGGWYSLDEIQQLKQIYPAYYNLNGEIITYYQYLMMGSPKEAVLASYRLFDSNEPESPIKDMFPYPKRSRKTIGFNGYVNITPSENVKFYLSGGYQNSGVMSSPVGDDVFSLNYRTSKTAYVALDANIYDLHVMTNYMAGSQDYVYGVAGFKVAPHYFNLSAEYDINLDCGLGIRPGIAYQRVFTEDYTPVWDDMENYKWHYEDPGYRFPEDKYENLSGFFQYTSTMTNIAPSLRFDYKKNGFRLIGAFRTDKTNIPDKWNHSWQFGASYEINNDNFIRVVYGRSNRGTNMVMSSANYTWTRTNMVYPYKLQFTANEESPLVKIDNIELGYRWKPAKSVLIDAEAFYSISDQYGALMANEAAFNVTHEEMAKVVAAIETSSNTLAQALGAPSGREVLKMYPDAAKLGFLQLVSSTDMGHVIMPYANIKYNELPYKVKQMGLSFNVDYIISSKLIAKLNGNLQKTVIDNYYKYNQSADILQMLKVAQDGSLNAVVVPGEYETIMGQTIPKYNITGDIYNVFNLIVQNYVAGDNLETATAKAQSVYGADKGTCYEYGNTLNVHDASTNVNGHKHKATPTYYGMLGLIYKPVKQLEVSAFANMLGKRTYTTKYGEEEFGNRLTMNMKIGYKPIDQMEVFFNAHNLFNTEKVEFAYADKIGGIYTVGVNFGF